MLRNYGSPFLISVFALLIAPAGAQSPVDASPSSTPAKFDVASIRPSPDPSRQTSSWMGVRATDGTFEARRMSLKSLVWFAYGNRFTDRQMVSGGGGWIDSRDWDIMAKVDDPSLQKLSDTDRSDRMRPLVRALLEERFQLKVHTETRPTPVYVLVQARGGAKVKEVPAPPAVEGDWIEAMKRFDKENPGKPFPGVISCSGERCVATAVAMNNAINQIQGSSHADRMVIDQTGLKGYYDFSFRSPGQDDDSALAEVEEDLGMKFEARKVDLATCVIDSAQPPTPN